MSAHTDTWHELVKQVLKDLGTQKGYDISESETEVILSSKFQLFSGDRRRIHSIICKPDVVWKKAHRYQAVFEVEYSNATEEPRLLEKKKYCIGSLMQAYMVMCYKSAKQAVFITNSERLHENMLCFLQLAPIKFKENIIVLQETNTTQATIAQNLSTILSNEGVLPRTSVATQATTGTPIGTATVTQPTTGTQPTTPTA